ncbi:MAG: DUF1003 domain-containing protein [Taibaiella sp.]|nr:DUF1003 domain-containing protein [Taibaiella sp.]
MDIKEPISIDDFKKKRKEILQSKSEEQAKKSFLDRLAVWITEHVGSMGFFMIIFTWTAIWLGWNILAPKNARFDPFPGFVLWLFISNMIQLFLMPLIMIGQNVQSRHADLRAEVDLKINMQAELETETILSHLEYQNKMIIQILKDIEKKTT